MKNAKRAPRPSYRELAILKEQNAHDIAGYQHRLEAILLDNQAKDARLRKAEEEWRKLRDKYHRVSSRLQDVHGLSLSLSRLTQYPT